MLRVLKAHICAAKNIECKTHTFDERKYLILGVSLKDPDLRAPALAVEVALIGDLLQPARGQRVDMEQRQEDLGNEAGQGVVRNQHTTLYHLDVQICEFV